MLPTADPGDDKQVQKATVMEEEEPKARSRANVSLLIRLSGVHWPQLLEMGRFPQLLDRTKHG